MLYYSIAHYYDRQGTRNNVKFDNIRGHIRSFLNIEEEKKFILVSFVDAPRGSAYYEKVKKNMEEFCLQYLSKEKYHVLIEFNWGGTIAALWFAYLYIKSQNISDTSYIAHFEEDFHATNKDWFIDSKNKLNSPPNYIYIGEHIPCVSDPKQNQKMCKVVKNDTRRQGRYIFKDIYSKYGCNIIDSKYTDGGYYFSNLKNLKCIEKKIGVFHKGNQNTKWNHVVDGIILGEVGFPSQVAQYYDFIGLDRKKYFSHEYLEH